MKWNLITTIVSVIVILLVSPVFADDRSYSYSNDTTPGISFFIGEKTWQSNGDNEWNIAQIGGSPNILSELEFLGLESTIAEIFGGINYGPGSLTIRYGFGSMRGGIYRDSDYLLDDRQGIYSLSTGDADSSDWNDMYYLNIEYSYRLITDITGDNSNIRYMNLLLGFQEWQEDVTITNGFQEIGGTLSPFAGLNSRYTFNWKSLLVGFEGATTIYKSLLLKGATILIPYTEYRGEGIWNLRSNFRQDPSFEHRANGGYGLQLDASLIYRISEVFEIDLGYRYWYMKSGVGTDTTYFSSGTVIETQFNEAVSKRAGVFLGLNYIL
jgi:hypothetical protein